MGLPEVASREEWLVARKKLLAKEKELTRARDALNAERRKLPMVQIDQEYLFEGPDGDASLLDLFAGRRQLVVQHVMYDPSWDNACSGCSASLDEISDGFLEHLGSRDTTMVMVSLAPYHKLEIYKHQRGWTFPWYSSYGSTFNYDFHVTLDAKVAPVEYNYRNREELAEHDSRWLSDDSMEEHGLSTFLQDNNVVYHTYSVYARGTEMTGGSYYTLDLTALGRQEDWELPKDRATKLHGADPSFSS